VTSNTHTRLIDFMIWIAPYHPDACAIWDLERLSQSLTVIHRAGATFVTSDDDFREAREVLAQWKPKRFRTRRHAASFAGNRRSEYEIIAINVKEYAYAD